MSSVSTDDDAYYQNDRNNSRRKKRKSRDNDNESDNNINIALSLIENHMPREVEESFVCAIFELGLKKSSPKVLMSLMNKSNPQSGLGSRFGSKLSTEHIKSHLQKYRIHHERSKLEFLTYYNEHMRDNFHAWENMKGWESLPAEGIIDTRLSKSNSNLRNERNDIHLVTNGAQDNFQNNINSMSKLLSDWRIMYEDCIADRQYRNETADQFDVSALHLKKLKTNIEESNGSENYSSISMHMGISGFDSGCYENNSILHCNGKTNGVNKDLYSLATLDEENTIRDYDNSREYQNNFNGIKSHFVKTIKGESSVKFQN